MVEQTSADHTGDNNTPSRQSSSLQDRFFRAVGRARESLRRAPSNIDQTPGDLNVNKKAPNLLPITAFYITLIFAQTATQDNPDGESLATRLGSNVVAVPFEFARGVSAEWRAQTGINFEEKLRALLSSTAPTPMTEPEQAPAPEHQP